MVLLGQRASGFLWLLLAEPHCSSEGLYSFSVLRRRLFCRMFSLSFVNESEGFSKEKLYLLLSSLTIECFYWLPDFHISVELGFFEDLVE